MDDRKLRLTARIAAAFAANNDVSLAELPVLIRAIHQALSSLEEDQSVQDLSLSALLPAIIEAQSLERDGEAHATPLTVKDLPQKLTSFRTSSGRESNNNDRRPSLADPTIIATQCIGYTQQGAELLPILVVDDDLVQREFLAIVLSKFGQKVICVNSGRDAIAAVAHGTFRAVLMDIRMPNMDGVEATRVIRSLKGTKLLPILAVTAQDDQEHIRRCLAAGMDGHLVKPIDPQTLLTSVMRAISLREAQADNRHGVGSDA